MSWRSVPEARLIGPERPKVVCIFDRRFQESVTREQRLETSGLDLNAFLRILSQKFSVKATETFVLVTTERKVLDADEFLRLQHGATLYMLQRQDQTLETPTEEFINFTPHHDTMVESGTYKYYDSEGKKALPYALADLIDNALTATANNTGVRTIEIRMVLDENQGKPAVIVLDNGCGMTSKQLNNWAVYKLSKFTRDSQSNQGGYVRPVHFHRSLNSDISYFGVGGKQAAFYIGKSTRMISKSLNSPDVHELVLSKSLFEENEKNKEDTYSATILNRKSGDFAHINKSQEQFLQDLIAEECNKESFTAVVITEVLPEHIHFLKEEFEVWTRQLAHIYHYYIHGVDGNIKVAVPKANNSDSNQMPKIDFLISFQTKSRAPDVLNLRSIDTDMQSQYIKAAASTFEFKAFTNPEVGIVEGIIRYHPFLYENETYPEDPDAEPAKREDHVEDDDGGDCVGVIREKKRKKPIFECFWNGRLIPFTTISEFDWCSPSSGKKDKVPLECYNRFSGVLFTDDTFKVTENKLTFIDLEKKLKNKDTVFSFILNGQKQRTKLQKEFNQWLEGCHQQFDKQIKFKGFLKTITRTDIQTKKNQHPWATFQSVECYGRVFKADQYVKTQKTLPVYHGKVVCFMFYGHHEGSADVFASGGQVEICLEPKGLYNCTKIIPLSKLDRSATTAEIKKSIENDASVKLPNKLQVVWPKENPWTDNSTQLAGTVLGPIQVQIVNKKGQTISRISPGNRDGRKLSVMLKLMHHVPGGDQMVFSYVAQQSAKWGFWFNKIGNFVELGKYTLYLKAVVADDKASESEDCLPHFKLRFTITEGKAEQFDVGALSHFRIGVPFDIPLELKDIYGHPVEAISDLVPILQCSGLTVTYGGVKCEGKIFLIKNVTATGKLKDSLQPNPFDLLVTLEGLKEHSKTLRIHLLPGEPHSIHVIPKDDPIHVENGDTVEFHVTIQDEACNATACARTNALCQVPGHSSAHINCSSGIGIHVTKPIKVSIVNGKPQHLKVQFSVPSLSNIKEVIRKLLILPSKRAHRMELYQQVDECLMLKNDDKIKWMAGSILENLYFKLHDEANAEVALTAAVASKIKVNWTGNMNQEELIKGKLPDVHVPTKVYEEHFYQVSYQDQSVSFSFTIIPIPDEAAGLKATVPNCAARLGESLPEPIILELVDQYANVTATLTPSCVEQIAAEGESLDKTHIRFKFQKDSCSVRVTGVCFTGGTPGYREMSLTFRSFTCQVKLKVAAGKPSKLNLVRGPTEPLYVYNGNGIRIPFLFQLCDKWDNPSPDQRVVVKMWPSPSELKVDANVSSQPVNVKGQASFTVMSVSGPKGYYQLNFEGIFNREPIGGPCVNLTVLPDPNKPVCLNVLYDTTVTFAAGELFPVFSVTVMSDEGNPITHFNPAAVSMLCWKGVLTGKTPPNSALEFQCNKPLENENTSSFYFREKPIPEDAGKYTVQFCLCERKKIALYSEQIIVNVLPNKPVKLAPDNPPPAQVVSYCQELAKRTLLENMTLNIVDQFGNAAGQGLNGVVEICITNPNSDSTEQHPLFEDKTDKFRIKLMDGKVHIKRLAVMKNSPGKDGGAYVVLFRPLLSPAPPAPLDSFEFHFSFSNDVQNQEKRVALSRAREKIKEAIRRSTTELDVSKSLIKEYSDALKEASEFQSGVKKDLLERNLLLPEKATPAMVDGIINEKIQEANQIRATLRKCRLNNDYLEQDVLGPVGLLALLENDAEAWVISWHLRGDMNCIITRTTKAARRIYDLTHGNQEVLPIDGISEFCKRPLQPLPHILKSFNAVGNPRYAVDALTFPHHQEECAIVFKNLLNNTILIDDLDSANAYRQMTVRNKMSCPAILTREGQRISGKGKFGGSQNRAPPRNQLVMFGAVLPSRFNDLQKVIGLLKEYKEACGRKRECEEAFTRMRTEKVNLIKQAESSLKDLNRQLEDNERQLETRVHPDKRVCPSSEGTSGNPAKRAKSRSSAQYR